jgi:hypothetical protein
MKLSDNELKVHLMSYEKNLGASTGGCRYRFVFDSKTMDPMHGQNWAVRKEMVGEGRSSYVNTFSSTHDSSSKYQQTQILTTEQIPTTGKVSTIDGVRTTSKNRQY